MQKTTTEKKKKRSFLSEYERLTMLQSSCPLSHVVSNIQDHFIDVNADRIRSNEWDPILASLKIDDSLSLIGFRSYWQVSCKGLLSSFVCHCLLLNAFLIASEAKLLFFSALFF